MNKLTQLLRRISVSRRIVILILLVSVLPIILAGSFGYIQARSAIYRTAADYNQKLVDVIRVFEMTDRGSLQRELVMLKIKATERTRTQIVEIGEIFKSKIIDVTPSTITLMLTGSLDKLESFFALIKPYGIVEMVRTGITALERGSRSLIEIGHDEDYDYKEQTNE